MSDLNHAENEKLSSLRSNSKQDGEYNGDHPPNDCTFNKEDREGSKEAKGVQNLTRNVLK